MLNIVDRSVKRPTCKELKRDREATLLDDIAYGAAFEWKQLPLRDTAEI